MKKKLNFFKIILMLAGVFSIPFLIRKKKKVSDELKKNIRYDNSDYLES
ncbi:MAG: hypothetical protein O3A55_05450 [Bacteroidetes bacterium]|nr:hypothetical protein [Bacteroidota bacterium]